jgi:beta-lactamase regulating signal transducer with metallopeptidase domain
VIPTGRSPFHDGPAAAALLAVWIAVAAALVSWRRTRDRRLLTCLEGLAAAGTTRSDVEDAVRATARWMGTAAPRVVAAPGDGTAFVAGARSPILFVPLALWDRLDVAGRRALLLHEIAHVRRRDPLRLAALSVVVDVLWPAFALRWTASRMRDAWEAQADEEAVQGGATRKALARSLVEAWSGSAPSGVLAFGGAAASIRRRLAALGRRNGAPALTLKFLALLWVFPWCPFWGGSDGGFRNATPRERDRPGLVHVELVCGNPLVSALTRGSLDRWLEELAAQRRADAR